MFSRIDDEVNEQPLRVVILSVEGNKTERQYFEYVEKYRHKLGIKATVHIHPLQRAKRDNLSAPEDVLELLEEYLVIRKKDTLPERLRNVIPEEYSEEFVIKYLNSKFDSKDERVKEFESILVEAGYDVVYNNYLKELKGENDVFGIVIDRDYKSHSVLQMKKIAEECEKNGYKMYITTPLFEFWLLLHLIDIHSLSKEELSCIKINEGVSGRHTYTSKLVSDIAGHSKCISEKVFQQFYLPNIDYAISQAKILNRNISELIGEDKNEETRMGNIGTNLPELFDILRENGI